MSMSVGGDTGGPVSEINVTPLADVMLVLLIIFMITAPLMSHPITVTVPTANPKSTEEKAAETPPLDLAIKEDGTMYFQDHPVTEAELKSQLAVAAQKAPQPELQIRAEKGLEWKTVRKVISDAKGQGMVHVGFMTTAPAKE
ncbi:MAG: biopolymer transporter ExbD [Rhodanobacter sp. 68-29]|uniref:ExbD/TolR family protein n=1 Tax=Rhodanobacter sp. PCA2 TaxID=2006117 RepID=UPI00086A874A|nr:biopolymer transporter ExbD [Rhodanobacter sp. PCA2]MBA2076894.1 biopolymer transporter ExbD [Rhodanobacter sp. PCA2]MBN8923898.1 biopolymer transporter ExbD [Rhodanobacter sp.]ODU75756.1 MAG: biopolymer transporter ExbD [Rhodanobacter sp. SCN 69-32]OJY57044.1 MAG: biopolymer transporter ExbD [Rhodanobacter sp. 68-29]